MTVRWTILADWGGQASYPSEVKAVGWGEGAPCSCVISCDLAQCVEILTPQVPDGSKTWIPDCQCYLDDHYFGSTSYSHLQFFKGSGGEEVGV